MELQVLRGVVAAIVTPFDPWDSVDLAAAGRLTGWLMDSGVHGIMTTGGTGEFPHLSRSERRGHTSAAVRQVGGRIPVIAGTGACGTREVLGLCEDAADVGADAVITVPPYYFPLPDSAIAGFFEAVADRSPLPVFVYNNPLYTGNSMRPSLIAEILCHDNIAGLKQSSSDLGQLVDVIQEVRVARDLTRALFTGVDSQFAGSLAVGADGIYSTAGGIIPDPNQGVSPPSKIHGMRQGPDEQAPFVTPAEYGRVCEQAPCGRAEVRVQGSVSEPDMRAP